MTNPPNTTNTATAKEIQPHPAIRLTAKENRVISFFKDATPLDWEDWRWQLRNRITTQDVLEKLVNLTPN